MCQLDWHRISSLNIISGCVCEVFSDNIIIWIGRFSKVDCFPQRGLASLTPRRAWMEQKSEEGEICPFLLPACLIKLGHFISSSLALRLGFKPSTPLFFKPSDSDWIIPLASRSLAYRRQMMAFLSLHNHVRTLTHTVRWNHILLY